MTALAKNSGYTRSRGFTLIELLVAIMILTLFMTASMGAVRIASRSWAVGQERSDATEEMRATADFLRRQFAQLPSLTIGEGDKERLAFAADEKRMRFVAPAPQYSHGAGLITYLLEVTTIDEQTLLTLRYAAFDPGSDELSHDNLSEPIILGAGFDGAGFQYYGAFTDDDELAWHSSWQNDAENYPLAVFIRTRPDPESHGWPDLVFELRSGESS
jgi:general secretion pathway protein J